MGVVKDAKVGSFVLFIVFSICWISPVIGAEIYSLPSSFEFIAPAGEGGGWDITIRTVAKTLHDSKLVPTRMSVLNRPGGGGAFALGYMQEKKGSDRIITVYSPPLILMNLNGTTRLNYRDITPLARLIADYACFVVKKDSKYKTIQDVMNALKKDPKSVKICGTSAVGSMDHLQFLKMAKAAGVKNLKDIDYVSFQDNTGAIQILGGGHIDVFSTGLADVKKFLQRGELRALASTADRRVGDGVLAQIPTCKEQGINATFVNWRGIFGAPGMSALAVKFWEDALRKMSETDEWRKACKDNGWDNIYANAADFRKFLDQTNYEYRVLLSDVGMLKK